MLTYGSGLGTRWNVFPSAVSWNQGNSETGPLGSGAAEINAAFSIWNAGGTHYVLSSANANPNGFLDATDGTNNIVFEKNLTSAGLQPFNCSSGGALGIAGMTHASFGAGTHVFHGETFATTLEADVSFNQGLGACSNFPQERSRALLVHEVGHTLGFRHSDQTRNLTASCAGDPTLDCTSSAIMNHILAAGTQRPAAGVGQRRAERRLRNRAGLHAAVDHRATVRRVDQQRQLGAALRRRDRHGAAVLPMVHRLDRRYVDAGEQRDDGNDRRRSGDHDVVLGPRHRRMRARREQQHRDGRSGRLRPATDSEHVEGSDGRSPDRSSRSPSTSSAPTRSVSWFANGNLIAFGPTLITAADANHAIPRARHKRLRIRRQQRCHDHRDAATAEDGAALKCISA